MRKVGCHDVNNTMTKRALHLAVCVMMIVVCCHNRTGGKKMNVAR